MKTLKYENIDDYVWEELGGKEMALNMCNFSMCKIKEEEFRN